AHVRDEIVDVMAELVPEPRGQAQRARPRGLAEVEHVAPVPRRRARRGDPLELHPQLRHPPGARRPRDVQVVTVRLDAEAEVHRVDRAILPHGALDGPQVGGRPEPEARKAALAAQLLHRDAKRPHRAFGHAHLARVRPILTEPRPARYPTWGAADTMGARCEGRARPRAAPSDARRPPRRPGRVSASATWTPSSDASWPASTCGRSTSRLPFR